jgi:protoporphyrinogen oxidase
MDNPLIIGAGPAGLTAAHRLAMQGIEPVLLEARDKVGGIACTEDYKGFLFDMGGHRFYSSHKSINALWNHVLGEGFLSRQRLSRIYYNRKFFAYPLKPFDAMAGIGPLNGLRVMASYLWRHLFPHRVEKTFEQWMTNRFGKRLFTLFFKSYTEKVWGVSCSELSAELAEQRVQNLSLGVAIKRMFRNHGNAVRSLVDQFHYPVRGPGMLWNAVKNAIEDAGGTVRLNHKVSALERDGNRIKGLVVSSRGHEHFLPSAHLISSMPITTVVRKLSPPPPAEVIEAAGHLKFRDYLTICLIVDREHLFPDQWIYIHDPDVRMARIQNYKNWSPQMVPDRSRTGLGLEYYCQAGDDLWEMPDDALVDLGKSELERIGLVDPNDVIDGKVYRVPNAYPVYDETYRRHLDVVKTYIDTLKNLQTIGRGGLFRYNNMDHSMLTAFCAVDNLIRDRRQNIWNLDS